MRLHSPLRTLPLVSLLALAAFSLACSDDEPGSSELAGGTSAGGTGGAGAGGAGAGGAGAGGAGGAGAGGAGASGASGAGTSGSAGAAGTGEPPVPQPEPGEVCADSNPKPTVVASAQNVMLTAGKSRTIDIVIQPDICSRLPVSVKLADGSKAQITSVGGAIPTTVNGAEATAKVDLRHPTIAVELKGLAQGDTTLEASFSIAGKEASVSVPVHVLDDKVPTCSGQATGKVNPGGALGGGGLLGATLGLQDKADQPAQTEVEGTLVASPTLWAVSAFDATVACAADIVPAGFSALGPAITFGPEAKRFPRELPMTIPINPALVPEKAHLRHIRVAYSGPAFKTPRLIPVTDLNVVQDDAGNWVLRFMAPRLGTYQAVVDPTSGTKTFKRRLTHRAIIGISMGGGGTALLGSRHHDMFDVIAPLGGPVDWSYMLDHIERNHTGGFLPNDGDTPPTSLAPMPEPRVPYEHPSTFNSWWYEYPREGNGGSFARGDYTQIFRDLSIMFGNPNGENKFPNGEHLPPGVDPANPAVKGTLDAGDCSVWVEPTEDMPNYEKLKTLQQKCGASRCANAQVLNNFYDRRFNPKGTWPVITVCDGGPQNKSKSPYSNQWNPSNDTPLEVALAVDYNNNGKRDENEPIITQGHEPWSDFGTDKIPSSQEPGYEPGVNEDPAGDDYDPQYNPAGTEGDGRYQEGEPFEDVGLDGVANTKDSPYDTGEGDGKFSASTGLQNFWKQDAHSIVHQWVTPPGGDFDDKALQRLDLWTDGGYRDLFNFAASAQHLAGTYAARGRNVAYYSRPTYLPGQNPDKNNIFAPQTMFWDNIPGSVLMRYGFIDPSKTDLDDGAGQHVGTVYELTGRLQSSLYFISKRWPDAPRTLVDKANNAPAPGAEPCQVKGSCTFEFADSRGRKGPVTVNFPPGYAHKDQQDKRYPVIYMLHGYGQSPEDLGAAIIFLGSWMNQGLDSSATRLSKAILVYVDGRCRLGADGSPECVRGTFYADSPRATGAKQESWFLDLTKEIDTRYRTMGETEVDWPAD